MMFKLFPWRIKQNKLRPFIGSAYNRMSFQQGDGPFIEKSVIPVYTGLVYKKGLRLFEIGGSYNPDNQINYFISKNSRTEIKAPRLGIWIGMRWMLDGTSTLENFTKRERLLFDHLKKNRKLNSYSFAVGASSSFFLKESDFLIKNYPYMSQSAGTFNMDLGIGYYYQPFDAHINVSYRPVNFNYSAYDTEFTIKRRSKSIEIFKFLFDYHGFVPFVGGGFNAEDFDISLSENGIKKVELNKDLRKAGIVFGWDIRPTETQWFILRTNLRYIPGLNVKASDGSAISLDQFEVNFIQLVFYPQRYFSIKKFISSSRLPVTSCQLPVTIGLEAGSR